ncbi:hypothetical protein [uncultured Xanthomonas sp.]|uniref:hypothetical protein n=2 Tax=uncultured Xanthomonas sp. TaxID=152831 RepID=UPI0025F47B38|nr:hypothetical protein [uncultured Xanthomonas sp.]
MAADPERVSAEGALRGVLSFGYFSLHKQRKVTRRQAKAFAVAFKLPTAATTTAEAKLSPLRASYFSLLAQRKGNQKNARPASRPPRCALRVRVHRGDPRKGHPAPAADGVHPCTPPFGYFPAMAAASEGNPVRQQQQQSKSKDQSDSNSNSDCKSKSKSKSKFKIGNSNNTSDSNSGADNAPL